ncbi:hypothetical protein G5714_006926 [Onychostoma macrolepis]|uniref:Uncharacterized protein n=1 Tax=Onychostoma macrolepis TaxID=369639 RepID=A0A7J6CYA3_9TELE|nr:hypothetical protein G5714_006926 [Onychostoma macrolepis]
MKDPYAVDTMTRRSRGEAPLDSSSPDFVPSLFVYTKQSQTPKTKMERYHRKRRRDERPDMQPASSMAEMEQDCTIDHCSDEEEAEGDHPVSRKEYDDLCFRHHQLQEDYINLQQDCYKLHTVMEVAITSGTVDHSPEIWPFTDFAD